MYQTWHGSYLLEIWSVDGDPMKRVGSGRYVSKHNVIEVADLGCREEWCDNDA